MKTIPEFPNYCATKGGRIWSKRRRDKMNHRLGDHYLSLKKDSRGKYLQVNLSKNGKLYTCSVHRLVLTAFKGECPEGMVSRHLDNNKYNNNISNLEWSSPEVNRNDWIKFGSHKGENNGRSKLTEEQVLKIRKLLPKFSVREIAKMFSISISGVKSIKHNRIWAWLR